MAFAEAGVDYLFIGKGGTILLGFPGMTQDVDMFPCKEEGNGRRIVAAAASEALETAANHGSTSAFQGPQNSLSYQSRQRGSAHRAIAAGKLPWRGIVKWSSTHGSFAAHVVGAVRGRNARLPDRGPGNGRVR